MGRPTSTSWCPWPLSLTLVAWVPNYDRSGRTKAVLQLMKPWGTSLRQSAGRSRQSGEVAGAEVRTENGQITRATTQRA